MLTYCKSPSYISPCHNYSAKVEHLHGRTYSGSRRHPLLRCSNCDVSATPVEQDCAPSFEMILLLAGWWDLSSATPTSLLSQRSQDASSQSAAPLLAAICCFDTWAACSVQSSDDQFLTCAVCRKLYHLGPGVPTTRLGLWEPQNERNSVVAGVTLKIVDPAVKALILLRRLMLVLSRYTLRA